MQRSNTTNVQLTKTMLKAGKMVIYYFHNDMCIFNPAPIT